MYSILLKFTDKIEAVSCDEALLDITGTLLPFPLSLFPPSLLKFTDLLHKSEKQKGEVVCFCARTKSSFPLGQGDPLSIGRKIKSDIFEKTGCNCTVGICTYPLFSFSLLLLLLLLLLLVLSLSLLGACAVVWNGHGWYGVRWSGVVWR